MSKGVRCPNCEGWNGKHIGTHQHSSLRDDNYKCLDCDAKWTYIMEGDRFHRFQLEYPKEKVDENEKL